MPSACAEPSNKKDKEYSRDFERGRFLCNMMVRSKRTLKVVELSRYLSNAMLVAMKQGSFY